MSKPVFDEVLLEKLQQALNSDPEAVRFVQSYADYCHEIDDLIDEKITCPERILKVFVKACMVFSSNFYHRHYAQLYPIVLLITNQYADSVAFERTNEEWKTKTADVLRLCGGEMLCLVVGIVAGYDAMREISPLVRELNYKAQHEDKPT